MPQEIKGAFREVEDPGIQTETGMIEDMMLVATREEGKFDGSPDSQDCQENRGYQGSQ